MLSRSSLILSTPLFDAASISITSRYVPSFMLRHTLHLPHGLPPSSAMQFSPFASILAVVVLPVPLVPQNRYAWLVLSVAIWFLSIFTIAPALVATLQRFIFTKTMVLKDKSGVRFVTLNSTLTKIDSQKPLPFVALTAPEHWNLSRVDSTLSFTNAETLNALTIFIILKKLIENI